MGIAYERVDHDGASTLAFLPTHLIGQFRGCGSVLTKLRRFERQWGISLMA
jgi:hypothetical protein